MLIWSMDEELGGKKIVVFLIEDFRLEVVNKSE